ncbi:MAG: hypothetical protein K1X61_15855 [Chitinophagales bacterium]|nr:hypothetical protein [Chitinophagales bacterium]
MSQLCGRNRLCRVVWLPVFSADYYPEDKTCMIETNIYAQNPNKLLWTRVPSALNTNKSGDTTDAIIAVNKAEWERMGFLQE